MNPLNASLLAASLLAASLLAASSAAAGARADAYPGPARERRLVDWHV